MTRYTRSGFCTAKPWPVPAGEYDPHERCGLSGCDCPCHVATAETPPALEETPRPKVPLACLQGRCDHDHDEVAGVRLVPDETLREDRIELRGEGGELVAELSTDPHTWPAELAPPFVVHAPRRAGKTAMLEALGDLTDDERRRIIAAHMVLHPSAILEAVAGIITERRAAAESTTSSPGVESHP